MFSGIAASLKGYEEQCVALVNKLKTGLLGRLLRYKRNKTLQEVVTEAILLHHTTQVLIIFLLQHDVT